MSLKQKAISGIRWNTISTIVSNILQLLQLSILTRLLDPSVFGLKALILVVIGFSQAFLDMGISNAIIHNQSITHRQLSTLYWVNVIAGFSVFMVVSAVSPLISFFYNKPQLTQLIILTSLTFLIQSFGQQFMVLWQKEMRYKEIAMIDISSKFVSLIISIVFAYLGHGVYSLVYGIIISSIIQTILYLLLGLREHKPSFVFNLNEVKHFLSFGAYQMGERTVNYFNYQIDTLLIGKLIGMEALGIYDIAKQLVLKPSFVINPIVSKVTFPLMSKVQNETTLLKNIYLKTINYLASINFPIFIFLIIFSNEIVSIMFGEKWIGAVPVLRILSLWGAIRSTGNPVGSLMLAKGRAKLGFYWNLALFLLVPLCIYFGSYWGVFGICWVLVFVQLIFVIPNWYFLVKPLCSARFFEYNLQIFKPALIACISAIFMIIATKLIDNNILRIATGSIVGCATLLGLNIVWNNNFLTDLIKLRSNSA